MTAFTITPVRLTERVVVMDQLESRDSLRGGIPHVFYQSFMMLYTSLTLFP